MEKTTEQKNRKYAPKVGVVCSGCFARIVVRVGEVKACQFCQTPVRGERK